MRPLERVDVISFFTAIIFVATCGMGYKMYSDSAERAARQTAWKERRAAEAREAQAKIDEPASSWYVLRGINLDNFIEGEDPKVVFDSDVKKPFINEWNLQVHGVDAKADFPPVCSTGDSSIRTPGDKEGLVILPWSQVWRRNPCDLKPGTYLVKYHGTLHIVGYPDKEVDRLSNIFTVLERGSLLSVPPEQVQQLEKAQKLLDNPKIIEQLGGSQQ